MAQRKELLKAHAFTQQRLVAALVDRDPDNPTPPLRRLGIATFVSVLIAAVIVGIFALYGLLKHPATPDWAEANTIVIDTESGVVFVTPDGKTLNPVTNITSARLITKGGNVKKATTESLASAPRGARYGIVDAPAQLPAASTMTAFPLRVCSLPITGKSQRYTVLDATAPAATSDAAIGLSVGDKTYLVVSGIAHLIPDKSLLGNATALKGSEAFLRSLPQGQEIAKYTGPKGNKAIHGDNLVGDVVYTGDQTDKSTWEYYLQLPDGYSAISYLDAMVNNPTPSAAKRETVANNRSEEHQNSATPGLPMGQVTVNSTDLTRTTVCATYSGDGSPRITIGDAVDGPTTDDVTPAISAYDRVTTTPGGGALLQSAGTLPDGATFLVWQGHKYGIPDLETRGWLGYESAPVVGVVQPSLLALIPDGLPAGVALDHEHANRLA